MALARLYPAGFVFNDLTGNNAADAATLEIYDNSTSQLSSDVFGDAAGLISISPVLQLGADGRLPVDVFVDTATPVRVRLLNRFNAQIFLEDDQGAGAASALLSSREVSKYIESVSVPPTPVGRNPAGWGADNTPPVGTGAPVYITRARVSEVNDQLIGSWSVPVVWTNSVPSGTRYYILSEDGGVIHNGQGTVAYEARAVTEAGDNAIASGPIQLFVNGQATTVANGFAAGSTEYRAVLDSGDINGDVVVELRNGAGGFKYDASVAVDLIDGADTTIVIISNPETSAFVKAANGGVWSDLSKLYPITVVQAGAIIENGEVTVTLNPANGEMSGAITTPNVNIAISFPVNDDANAIAITATHTPTQANATETVYAVYGGDQGADGNTVLSGVGAPVPALGVDGDYYIDTAADNIYGPKSSGAWGAARNITGSDGIDGSTTINGSGAPGSGIGVDGDYYIDTVTGQLYGPKGTPTAGSWVGVVVIALRGAPGIDGKTIISGTGVPNPATGTDGDYYIDTVADVFYGPKAGGAWGAGAPILSGADGIDGSTILNGTGAPIDALGVNGDYYLRDDGDQLYGPKGTPNNGSWSGVAIRNLAGADGNTILSGNGVPPSALGNDGDYYIDDAGNDLYGPKTGGAWNAGTSLAGADGASGNLILNGVGFPINAIGSNGDYYQRTDTNELIGPKGAPTSNSWAGANVVALVGPAGPAGNTMLSGAGAPSNAIGTNGDFYIDTTNDNYHGPKAGGIWPGAVNIVGSDGIDGATIISGTALPVDGVGNNGDYYFQTTTGTLFGPKAGGTWTGAPATPLAGSGIELEQNQINTASTGAGSISHNASGGNPVIVRLSATLFGSGFSDQTGIKNFTFQRDGVTLANGVVAFQTIYIEEPGLGWFWNGTAQGAVVIEITDTPPAGLRNYTVSWSGSDFAVAPLFSTREENQV